MSVIYDYAKKIRRSLRFAARKVLASKKEAKCQVDPSASLYPESRIINCQGRDAIQIGERSVVLSTLHTFGHGGRIKIGNFCFLGPNSNIWSAESIEIGNRVLISHGVNVHDSISHSLSATERHQHFLDIFSSGHPKVLLNVRAAPIVIEDDAWLGFNSTVLKGVTIGRGAVIGACSVVTKDVPPYAIMVGNPAVQIGTALP